MMDREKILESFSRKGFQAKYFHAKEEALSYLEMTIRDKRIGIGGSISIKELGLYDVLKGKNHISWHWITNDRDTRIEALNSDVYILSANGVSTDGALVNIDGSGNRVAASLYGPQKVIYIIGKNKLEPNLERAIWRARSIAAPKNALRFNLNTPCAKSNEPKCYDCNSPDRICNGIVIVERPMKGQEVEVIFIDEDLGY